MGHWILFLCFSCATNHPKCQWCKTAIMLTDSMGQELRQNVACFSSRIPETLVRRTWKLGWLGGWALESSACVPTCLVVDASWMLGLQLGIGLKCLHVTTPCGLYPWGNLGVFTACWLGYMCKCLTRQNTETACFLSPGPVKQHRFTSAILLVKQSQNPDSSEGT